jgi:tetratricopeptide (TPR) repeat protein
MGILYYETKRFKEAKATLDSAAALNTDDAELFYYQAKLMYDGKAYKPALDACSRAIDLKPKYIDVLYLRGEDSLCHERLCLLH